jgi:hypothetical protein
MLEKTVKITTFTMFLGSTSPKLYEFLGFMPVEYEGIIATGGAHIRAANGHHQRGDYTMKSTNSRLQYRTRTAPTSLSGSLVVMIGALVGLFAVFVALSAPRMALAVIVGTLAATVALQHGLAVLVRRHGAKIRELSVPGVGTVRFRVLPR